MRYMAAMFIRRALEEACYRRVRINAIRIRQRGNIEECYKIQTNTSVMGDPGGNMKGSDRI